MKKLYSIVGFYVATILLLSSCSRPVSPKRIVISTDTISSEIIADTITYDVVIKNSNPDDYWTDECLRHLERESFINNIFSSLYSRDLIAYDFHSGKPLSKSQIESIEKEDWFSRESIGKIQFTEIWYYNSTYCIMDKKILSLIFGVEQFNNLGELKGYKPLFKVNLN